MTINLLAYWENHAWPLKSLRIHPAASNTTSTERIMTQKQSSSSQNAIVPCSLSGSSALSLMKHTAVASVSFSAMEAWNCSVIESAHVHSTITLLPDRCAYISVSAPRKMNGVFSSHDMHLYVRGRQSPDSLAGGNDFRPDYKKLGILKQQFPEVPIIALTATATHRVRRYFSCCFFQLFSTGGRSCGLSLICIKSASNPNLVSVQIWTSSEPFADSSFTLLRSSTWQRLWLAWATLVLQRPANNSEHSRLWDLPHKCQQTKPTLWGKLCPMRLCNMSVLRSFCYIICTVLGWNTASWAFSCWVGCLERSLRNLKLLESALCSSIVQGADCNRWRSGQVQAIIFWGVDGRHCCLDEGAQAEQGQWHCLLPHSQGHRSCCRTAALCWLEHSSLSCRHGPYDSPGCPLALVQR